jgi:molybdopterin synthase sulfur carrier subunit
MPVRVHLPFHLRTIAKVTGEVQLELGEEVTQMAVLDALEAKFPALRGTIRDHSTHKRRDFVRFFVCQEDWSNEPSDKPLPPAIVEGREPFLIIGALAGG